METERVLSIVKLSRLPMFASVPRSDLEDLPVAPTRQHARGTALFQQGDAAEDAVRWWMACWVCVCAGGEPVRQVGSVRPGEIAGEQGLFVRGGVRNALVVATQPVTLRLTPGLLHAAQSNAAVVTWNT